MPKNPLKPQHYGVQQWGDDYFSISVDGMLQINLSNNPQDLHAIAHAAIEQGADLPLLIRFPGILRHRASSLCKAFALAADELGYTGKYQGIYPIKVNQQRTVIEEIVKGGNGCIGLEAGSKPELMAVLSLSQPGSVIVCNGYKDREYIRLALIGRALGMRVYIVIEKMSELSLVEKESESLGIEPLLGVRIRLATSAAGNWQNSGGEKAKFGLTATQLISFVGHLKANNKLHWLQLLHSHIGSQIPNLRDIANGVNEAGRYYAELHKLGARIDILDVGGGLGIDYEGTRSRNYCSINYTLNAYARAVTKEIQRICLEEKLPEPNIFSESGRALTAHHAALLTSVIDSDRPMDGSLAVTQKPESDAAISLINLYQEADTLSPNEAYEEARYIIDEVRRSFEDGSLNIHQWSQIEQLHNAISLKIRPQLNPHKQRHRELLDNLNLILAEKVFLNFSLFQSTPDVWAIEQIFPIMPLSHLNDTPTRNVILHDLTCDSDGCIDHYVDQDGIESTLPLHDSYTDNDYLLGIFLVGAYQEILGDMHNLFGDTHAINVEIDTAGFKITEIEKGDGIDELLRYVHFDTNAMLQHYREQLSLSDLSPQKRDEFFKELSAGLSGYSYHEE